MAASKFTYHYNASALGLGGVLKDDRDVTTIVPSLASVALADSGGEGFVEITNYDKDGVSFSHASCRVIGYDSAHKTFTTSSDVYITNLNLFGRVKAAILQTSINSTREMGGDITTESDPDTVRFTMHSMIRGLTIDGVEVIPQFDLELCGWPTYAEFDKAYAKRLGVPTRSLAMPTASVQPIRTSFVKALEYAATPTLGPSEGFKLPVTKFGIIHFGELVVKPGNRRVNLLRIEFDSMLRVRKGGAVPKRMVSSSAAMKSALSDGGDVSTTTSSPRRGTLTMLSQDSNGVPSWP
jgi:hypothetical protein